MRYKPKTLEPDTLTSIAGFWRANITQGPDRGFPIIIMEGAPAVARVVAQCLKGFSGDSPAEQEEFLSTVAYEQLRQVADLVWSTATPDGLFLTDSLSQDDKKSLVVLGLANIAILEAHGRLISDEYNGMRYTYQGA